ncbi:MAG: GlyGly-CTERM sorting domain-containing protein [Verrucomicrobiota bacterium]
MNLISPVLANFYWIGGGSVGLVILIVLIVLLVRR